MSRLDIGMYFANIENSPSSNKQATAGSCKDEHRPQIKPLGVGIMFKTG
jgi:hypothetical protein